MSWLGDHTGIHLSPQHGASFNRDQFGGMLQNVAPASFLIPGVGPGLAALLGGAGGALGKGMQHGANFGSIAKAGAVGAGSSEIGEQLQDGALGRLRDAFTPGSGAGATTGGGFNGYVSNGNGGYSAMGSTAGGGGGVGSAFSALGGAAKSIGSFAKDNPNAIGSGLQGLGGLASTGSENRLRNSQADRLDVQNQLDLNEQAAQKRRAEALAPFLRSLIGQANDSASWNMNMAPNPYAPRQS